MRLITVFSFLFLVFLLTHCQENGVVTPETGPVLEAIGETGLIHDDSVFYESPNYWVSVKPGLPPQSFDLRDKALAFPTPGDQGNCGSCWAYSTHQALEIWRGVNKGEKNDLSAQFLLSCSGNGSCGGGTMSVVSWLAKSGLPPEASFPYVARDVKCKFSASEISQGFGNQVIEAPWVGESIQKSRYWKLSGKLYVANDKIKQIQEAMVQLNSPAVVTVSAYGASGNDVVTACKSLNSGGNHMVDIIGWDNENGGVNAHVYNSWGSGHGLNGISRIKWDCNGSLNRGLGVSARVLRGDLKPPCDPPQDPKLKPEQIIFLGSKVEVGKPTAGVKCNWAPATGLKDPNACLTEASPEKSTEYHLTITNDCGSVSAMTFVRVFAPVLTGGGKTEHKEGATIVTPLGEVSR